MSTATAAASGQRLSAPLRRRPQLLLAALLALDAVLLLHMGRGLSFYYDEWEFVVRQYGGGVDATLHAHAGNIVLFPVLVYKALFHLVGLSHPVAYRLVVIVLHLLVTALVYALAARRVGPLPALLAATLILFLGEAWEDLLWAFQMGYMFSVAGGLGAWLLLEREERWAGAGATLFLILAVGSSSLGIALVAGVAVELLWRRQLARLYIAAVPGFLYLLWYLGYGESQVTAESLIHAPGYAEELAAMAFGTLIGQGLDWGRPLAVAGVAVLLVRLVRPVPVSARLAGLVATGVALWAVIAVARSTISPPETSRYTYFGAVVIVLVGVELLAAAPVALRAVVVAAPLVAFFALTGLTAMRSGAKGLRETSQTVTAELGAMQVAAAYAPAGYQPDPILAPPVYAGAYLHAIRSIGSSPADTPAQIAAANPYARGTADRVLFALAPPRLGAPSRRAVSSCRTVALNGATATATVALPAGGLLIRAARRGSVAVSAKRFSDNFTPVPGSPATGVSGLSAPPDSAQAGFPWQLQLSSAAPFALC